jgi:hypothetical protein
MTLAELVHEIESDPQKLSFPFLIISPYSRFKKLWNSLLFILLLYSVLVFPVRLAFFESDDTFFKAGIFNYCEMISRTIKT